MAEFPNILTWRDKIGARAAAQARTAAGADFGAKTRSLSDEGKRESAKMLMGQTAATLRGRSRIVSA